MKTLKQLLKISFFLALFTACSSDDGGTSTSGANYHVTAKIDGNSYSNSNYFEPLFSGANGVVVIQSSDNSGNSIQIQIQNYQGEGTYISGNNNIQDGYINFMKAGSTIGQFTTYTSVRGTGEVIVTAASDTEISGTFKATAYQNETGSTNKVEITQGSFKVKKAE